MTDLGLSINIALSGLSASAKVKAVETILPCLTLQETISNITNGTINRIIFFFSEIISDIIIAIFIRQKHEIASVQFRTFHTLYSDWESNPDQRFRKPPFYPLNYQSPL